MVNNNFSTNFELFNGINESDPLWGEVLKISTLLSDAGITPLVTGDAMVNSLFDIAGVSQADYDVPSITAAQIYQIASTIDITSQIEAPSPSQLNTPSQNLTIKPSVMDQSPQAPAVIHCNSASNYMFQANLDKAEDFIVRLDSCCC